MNNFLKITSNDNWFKQHPEKIAGVEYETTSFYFPIMVKGTKEDVLRVTGITEIKQEPTIEKQDNSRTPIELLRIIENGYQIAGVTRIDFEDNFKTIIYGTKVSATRISVIGKEVEPKEDYEFEKRNYNEEKSKNFDVEIRETLQSRLPNSEKIGIVKMLNQRKKHLPVIEKIILPFYEYHLGINPDKKKRIRLAKAKAKAIKVKLSLGQLGISIDTEAFRKMTVSELRKFTLAYYNENLKGKKVAIKNHLKEVVFVGGAGRKMLQPIYSEKVAVIQHLEELIKNSTYNNFGERKEKDSNDVLGYLNFKSKLTIDGAKRHVRISVILDRNRKTKLKTFEVGGNKKSGDLPKVAVASPKDGDKKPLL